MIPGGYEGPQKGKTYTMAKLFENILKKPLTPKSSNLHTR
jgi:hypothetical protein